MHDLYLKRIKDLSQNSQNRGSDEMANGLFETYTKSVMKHGYHIYETAYYMSISTMCKYLPSKHALTHWKYVLRCCAK